MPERIQRRRTAGWEKPAGAVAVTRGTVWGNPFEVTEGLAAGAAVAHHAAWLANEPDYADVYAVRRRRYDRRQVRERISELCNRDVMCWCGTGPGIYCHGETLMSMAKGLNPRVLAVCGGRRFDPETNQPVGEPCGRTRQGSYRYARSNGWVIVPTHSLPGRPPAIMCPQCAKPDPELRALLRDMRPPPVMVEPALF